MKSILILFIIGIVSCNSEKPQILFIEELSYNYELLGKPEKDRFDVFLIRYPPHKKSKTLELAIRHCDSIFLLNDSILNHYERYSIAYYKVSRKTPIDFVEDPGGFSTDVLDQHTNDFILSCTTIPPSEFASDSIYLLEIKHYNGYKETRKYKKIGHRIKWQ